MADETQDVDGMLDRLLEGKRSSGGFGTTAVIREKSGDANEDLVVATN